MRLIFLLSLLFFTFPIVSANAAEFILKNGTSVKGEVLAEEASFIRIKSDFGIMEIQRSEIAKADYTDGKAFKMEYPVVGLSFGLPAVGNLAVGYYGREFGVKASGMHWGGIWGAQINLSKKIHENRDFLLNGILIGGHIQQNFYRSSVLDYTEYFDYAGLGVDLNLVGIYGLLSPVFGQFDDRTGFGLIWEVGYLHRFN